MSDASQLGQCCEQLPDPWATLCRLKGSLSFAWAHDGEHRCGWVELLPDGVLSTKWGTGSWERDDNEPLSLKLTFGSSCHVCRLLVDEGKFQVEKRTSPRGGQVKPAPKIKGVEVVSVGWSIDSSIHRDKQPKQRKADGKSVEKTLEAKQKAAEVAEEKRKAAVDAAVAAAEAAAEAAAKATEMENLAKKAEAAKSKAELRAQQAKKDLEDALLEKETTGLGRFGFVTPLKRSSNDAVEEDGSPDQKRPRMAQKATNENESILGETASVKVSVDASDMTACTAKNDIIGVPACVDSAKVEVASLMSMFTRSECKQTSKNNSSQLDI